MLRAAGADAPTGFTPDGEVDLVEGTQVKIQIAEPVDSDDVQTSPPISGPPFISEEEETILAEVVRSEKDRVPR